MKQQLEQLQRRLETVELFEDLFQVKNPGELSQKMGDKSNSILPI